MSVPVVKFNTGNQPEFFKELQKRVNTYFKDKKISRHANRSMKFKTAFMLTLYTAPLILMLTGVVSNLWAVMLMWILMGVGMSGIGLSIMHDANHGSYSRNPKVNKALGYLLNLIGGYHVNWKIQHNVLHHSYTNVDGFDEDIDHNLLRLSPHQERKWIFKFQAIYAPILYGLMTIYWFIAKDFQQLARYEKMGLLKGQGLTKKKALTQVVLNKAWYIGLTIVLPILLVNLAWWQTVLGFLLMQFISGLWLALIFQPAHVVEETEFFEAEQDGSMENHWAIHQMKTTTNFANRSRLFSWFIGGLNYQIEHHLFPNICHIHYRHISSIVRKTAQEYGIPYHHHRTFAGALRSHFSLLHSLGTGKFDKRMAMAKA